jgi:hypothetical protein
LDSFQIVHKTVLIFQAPIVFIFQALIVCCNAAVIYSDGSVKIVLRLLFIFNWIRSIICLPIHIALNQRPTPQVSQPRSNLLANEPSTALTPNFEDVEQPPLSYEEYLAQGNDMPPKYEDEKAPPAYQETML